MDKRKQRLFEVVGRLDKTFKHALNESREHLVDYFVNMWSKSAEVQKLINSNKYMIKKYGQYLEPTFDWNALSDAELKSIWDEWSVDEVTLTNMPRLGDDSREDDADEYLAEGEDQTFQLSGADMPVFFKLEQYDKNGSLAVELWDDDGPYATVSSNLTASDQLPADEFYLKHWGENEYLAQELIDKKIIIPTGNQEEEMGASSYKISPKYSKGGIVEDGMLNELDYETAKAGAAEYEQRIKGVLSEFDNQKIRFTQHGSAQNALDGTTRVSIAINALNPKNNREPLDADAVNKPYSISTQLYVETPIRKGLTIQLFKGVTDAALISNWISAPQETIDFLLRYVDTAAQYSDVSDPQKIEDIKKVIVDKLSPIEQA